MNLVAPTTKPPTAERPEWVSVIPAAPTTLVELFERLTRLHKKPNSLNYKQNGRWLSISSDELLRRSRRIAAGLYSVGLKRGDRVAILSESRPEWTLTDAGCLFAGAVDVPIYPTLGPPQVRYLLHDSGARILFLANYQKAVQLKEVVNQCPEIEHLILFEENEAANHAEFRAQTLSLAQLEQRGRTLEDEQPDLIDQLAHRSRPDELATIIYTSGTTGEPKGVMLTHSNLVSNIIDSAGHFSFSETDTVLSVLPLSHVFERTAMYMYLHHGLTVYFGESFEKIGQNLREVRPTIFVGVPRIFEKIFGRVKEKAVEKGKLNQALLAWAVTVGKEYAKQTLSKENVPLLLGLKHRVADRLIFSKWRQALGGRIRLLVSGGAALAEELVCTYLGAGLPILQGYGLTETSPVITAAKLEDNRVGAVGKPIRNVSVRIAPDGEIETRGPHVMRGYYNKPLDTKAVFTDDGWFKTGDIGFLDEDGFLHITDRKKELLKTSGGKYIAPQPIEQLIKGSRFVNQVVLVGNGRKFPAALIVPDWERLESYVQLKGIEVASRHELVTHPRIINLFERQVAALTPDLGQFERVKKIALLENELTIEGGELTPTLKVKRRVIDQKYRRIVDALYEDAEKPRNDSQ